MIIFNENIVKLIPQWSNYDIKKSANVLGFFTASLLSFLINFFWSPEIALGQRIFSSIGAGIGTVLGLNYLPKFFHWKKKII